MVQWTNKIDPQNKVMTKDIESVNEYILSFSKDVQEKLYIIRNIILKAAPHCVESIAYKMPAYRTEGKALVYFAGYKNHIGFYATPTGHAGFKSELSRYKQGKGSVQFPLNEPLPVDLIKRIVDFRAEENFNKIAKK